MRKCLEMVDAISNTAEGDDHVMSDASTCCDESQSEEAELIPLEGASSKI